MKSKRTLVLEQKLACDNRVTFQTFKRLTFNKLTKDDERILKDVISEGDRCFHCDLNRIRGGYISDKDDDE
jgi:hypothetical protein